MIKEEIITAIQPFMAANRGDEAMEEILSSIAAELLDCNATEAKKALCGEEFSFSRSEYDNIQSAKELVRHIQFHGLSTKQVDRNRAADIIGNSSVQELVELANDIGRNDADGNPDPNGSWSSSRRPTQGTFYHLLSLIWNWEDVCRFWDQHTNPSRKRLEEKCSEWEKKYNAEHDNHRNARHLYDVEKHKVEVLEAKLASVTEAAEAYKRTAESALRAKTEINKKIFELYDAVLKSE